MIGRKQQGPSDSLAARGNCPKGNACSIVEGYRNKRLRPDESLAARQTSDTMFTSDGRSHRRPHGRPRE